MFPLAPVILPDYPAADADRDVAAPDLDRLARLGKIHRYEEGSYPPDLRVRSSDLIVKTDNVRAARDWPTYQFPFNSALAGPPVEYGARDGFLGPLPPGACVGGIDLQHCLLRWLVSPSCRRRQGGRRPVSWAHIYFCLLG